jgi:hypothetical protein
LPLLVLLPLSLFAPFVCHSAGICGCVFYVVILSAAKAPAVAVAFAIAFAIAFAVAFAVVFAVACSSRHPERSKRPLYLSLPLPLSVLVGPCISPLLRGNKDSTL